MVGSKEANVAMDLSVNARWLADTIITEGGGNFLSRTETAPLYCNRIMLSLPPMLILDEATSSNH